MKKFLINTIVGFCLFTCGMSCIIKEFGDVPKKVESSKHEYSTTINTVSEEEALDCYEDLEEEKKMEEKEVGTKEIQERKEEKAKETHKEKEEKVAKATKKVNKPVKKTTNKKNSNQTIERNAGKQVWVTGSGSKYHSHNSCGKTNSRNARLVSLSEAQKNYTPCKKCF